MCRGRPVTFLYFRDLEAFLSGVAVRAFAQVPAELCPKMELNRKQPSFAVGRVNGTLLAVFRNTHQVKRDSR